MNFYGRPVCAPPTPDRIGKGRHTRHLLRVLIAHREQGDHKRSPLIGANIMVRRGLLPLPACHQGVYTRLRRAMERVGVRGFSARADSRRVKVRFHEAQTRGDAPSSGICAKRGEVRLTLPTTNKMQSGRAGANYQEGVSSARCGQKARCQDSRELRVVRRQG
jgi:hypothetical protein